MDVPSAEPSGSSLTEPAPAGEELPEPTPEQPSAEPAPQGGEQPAAAGANKLVQQLTGQLGQQIRTAQDITSDDIKGAVNSILAASKGKLQADAVSDIQKKLNAAVSTGGEQPAQQPTGEEIPMQEEVVEENETDIMSNGLIQDIVRRAGLAKQIADYPEGLAFDICEGIYIFVMDHNDNSDFIVKLKTILRNNEFKASPMIGSFEDLQENGQAVYNALVKMEQDILKPRPQNRTTIPRNAGGFSLNESQKALLLNKLKNLD